MRHQANDEHIMMMTMMMTPMMMMLMMIVMMMLMMMMKVAQCIFHPHKFTQPTSRLTGNPVQASEDAQFDSAMVNF